MCIAANDAMCAASQGYQTAGHCRNVGDHCQAVTDADCSGSDNCMNDGWCTARGGHCGPLAAGSADDSSGATAQPDSVP
jgi:hypothetical protein